MSPTPKVVSLYQGKELPSQREVIAAFGDLVQENKGQEDKSLEALSDEDVRFLCYASARANHTRFMTLHLLPSICQRQCHGWLSWLLFGMRLDSLTLSRQSWNSLFSSIEAVIPLDEMLTKPMAHGYSPWDELLVWGMSFGVNPGDIEPYIHPKLAYLSRHITSRPPEFLQAPHPLYPEYSRLDVWLWSWCCVPMSSSRINHVAELLALGANPDTALDMEEGPGKLSTGGALLLSYKYDLPRSYYLVNDKSWSSTKDRFNAVFDRLGEWDNPKDIPEPDEKNADISCVMSTLRLLLAGGMNVSEMTVNHELGAPLLVLYNALQRWDPIWSMDDFKLVWAQLLEMGLTLHHPKKPEVNLITALAKADFSRPNHPGIPHLLWVSSSPIPPQTRKFLTDPASLLSLAKSTHGACLFVHEPRLAYLLVKRFHALLSSDVVQFLSANNIQITCLDDVPQYKHPLSCIASGMEEVLLNIHDDVALGVVIAFVQTMISDVLLAASGQTSKFTSLLPADTAPAPLYLELTKLKEGISGSASALADLTPNLFKQINDWLLAGLNYDAPAPDSTSMANVADGVGSTLTAAEQRALDTTDRSDPRPTALLYLEKDAQQFNIWASSRESESANIKHWKEKVYSKKNGVVSLPIAARPLALASSALSAIAHLRSAFPHFTEIVDLIERHLILESRGRGAFSLPPLLMAGPPGTGKTFFFQELAAAVQTHYSMLSMEGVSGGFSIVGLDYGWASSSPGHVFETLMSEKATLNPIILLDELDKTTDSNYPVSPVLLPLLEPHSARRFTDRAVPMTIDASHICWVATANDLDAVSLPLRSRFTVLHVPQPDYHARRAMAGHIYTALRSKSSWGSTFDEHMSEETIQTLARPNGAARDLRKNISEGFAAAAKSGRSSILPQDIPTPPQSGFIAPWDQPLSETKPAHINVINGVDGVDLAVAQNSNPAKPHAQAPFHTQPPHSNQPQSGQQA